MVSNLKAVTLCWLATAAALTLPPPLATAVARPRCPPPMLAKKGNRKKKGGGGKKGMAWAKDFEVKPTESAALRELAESVASTFQARTGTPLLEAPAVDLPKALWSADVAVVVVAESAADGADAGGADAGGADADGADAEGARVLYANRAACEAHGLDPGDHKALIGARTALAATMAKKFEGGYSKRLPTPPAVEEATLVDASRMALERVAVVDGKLVGTPVGVAYVFAEWRDAAGATRRPGGVRIEPALSAAEVEERVAAQGAEVRRLKEEDGLANGDPAVASAVAELLRLKALLEVAE